MDINDTSPGVVFSTDTGYADIAKRVGEVERKRCSGKWTGVDRKDRLYLSGGS